MKYLLLLTCLLASLFGCQEVSKEARDPFRDIHATSLLYNPTRPLFLSEECEAGMVPRYEKGDNRIVAALVPEEKTARDEVLGLRGLLGYPEYQGQDWVPWITSVPWYPIKGRPYWAVVITGVGDGAARPVCQWLSRIGWGYYQDRFGRVMHLMANSPISSRMCELFLPSEWGHRQRGKELGPNDKCSTWRRVSLTPPEDQGKAL
jgi:hypothetical protein